MKKIFVLGLVLVGLAACCCDRGYYQERTYTRPVEVRAASGCDCGYAARPVSRCGC